MSYGQSDLGPTRLDLEVVDLETDPLKIIAATRPHWDLGQVKSRVFTDGITNKLIGFYMEGGKDDVVLVRVYGEKTDLFIDRQAEVRNFQMLHSCGRAPHLYAIFKNGLAYEFVEGEVADTASIQRPSLFRAVCAEMAAFHLVGRSGNGGTSPQPCLWRRMDRYLDLLPENSSLRKCDLQCEVATLRARLPLLGSPVVFCHNDLLLANIICHPHNNHNQVTFIDYEYTDYNYQAYDIANHFAEFAGVEEVDYSLYPDKSFQMEWLRTYLSAFQDGCPGGGLPDAAPAAAGDDRQVEQLYVQVNQFALAAHLFWTLWALVQSHFSTIPFDFKGYAKIRFDEYKRRKSEFLSLKMPS